MSETARPGLLRERYAGHRRVTNTNVWRRLSWPRVAALLVLGLLGLLAPHVTALVLSACAAITVVMVAAWDYVLGRKGSGTEAAQPAPPEPA